MILWFLIPAAFIFIILMSVGAVMLIGMADDIKRADRRLEVVSKRVRELDTSIMRQDMESQQLREYLGLKLEVIPPTPCRRPTVERPCCTRIVRDPDKR